MASTLYDCLCLPASTIYVPRRPMSQISVGFEKENDFFVSSYLQCSVLQSENAKNSSRKCRKTVHACIPTQNPLSPKLSQKTPEKYPVSENVRRMHVKRVLADDAGDFTNRQRYKKCQE
jgi:hypothetical protein